MGWTGDVPALRRTMSDDWPAWATQEVEIVDWDAGWPPRAAGIVAELEPLLDPWLAGAIEHIGSTSVAGLAAKPVIDLQAPLRSLTGSAPADRVLADAGWHLVPPELDQRPWRRLHVLPDGDRRLAHLHLVQAGDPRCREALDFRDRLRREPALRTRYERLKRAAADEHRRDREAYTDAKAEFIRGARTPHP